MSRPLRSLLLPTMLPAAFTNHQPSQRLSATIQCATAVALGNCAQRTVQRHDTKINDESYVDGTYKALTRRKDPSATGGPPLEATGVGLAI